MNNIRGAVYLIFTWTRQRRFERISLAAEGKLSPTSSLRLHKKNRVGLSRCIVSLKYSNQLSQHITWNIKAKSGVGVAFGYLRLHKNILRGPNVEITLHKIYIGILATTRFWSGRVWLRV